MGKSYRLRLKTNTCRFCLETCHEDSEKIDKIISEIIDILSMKLNLKIVKDPVMCEDCTKCVRNSFDFKSMCFYTEERVFVFKNLKDNEITDVNLREVYMVYQESELAINKKLCRFCMELKAEESFIPLCEVDECFLQKCIPEMDFSIVKNPVVCQECHESLKNYAAFVDVCRETEDKIKRYMKDKGTNECGQVSLSEVLTFSKEKHLDIAEKTKANLSMRKTLDTKPNDSQKIHCLKPICKQENDDDEIGKIKYKAPFKPRMTYHYTEEEIERRPYACDLCPYRATQKAHLMKHYKIHRDPSELQWYSCDVCTYKSPYRRCMNRHLKAHYKKPQSSKKPSKAKKNRREFFCGDCDYKSFYKAQLGIHIMQLHTDPADAVKFECDECSFSSFYKNKLKRHKLRHETPSKAASYCETRKAKAMAKNTN